MIESGAMLVTRAEKSVSRSVSPTVRMNSLSVLVSKNQASGCPCFTIDATSRMVFSSSTFGAVFAGLVSGAFFVSVVCETGFMTVRRNGSFREK